MQSRYSASIVGFPKSAFGVTAPRFHFHLIWSLRPSLSFTWTLDLVGSATRQPASGAGVQTNSSSQVVLQPSFELVLPSSQASPHVGCSVPSPQVVPPPQTPAVQT